MNHTPGPWVSQYPRIKQVNGDTVIVLAVGSRNDATLITAAPEMYEALCVALQAMKADVATRIQQPSEKEANEAVMAFMQAALNKAKGNV